MMGFETKGTSSPKDNAAEDVVEMVSGNQAKEARAIAASDAVYCVSEVPRAQMRTVRIKP